MNRLIGADPELFLVDRDGNYVSAIGRFGGTKEHPLPIPGFRDGFAVQEDNVAVEFNIPPTKKAKQFSKYIQSALDFISEKADKMNLKVAVVASALFPASELDNPQAQRFGCDSDFNIWTLSVNPMPSAKNKNLRSAGGHIHIAYPDDRLGIGRASDLFIGCPSILFDADTRRRELYGKAGACREKEYGVEYRTPSNFWIKSPELCEMVFEQSQKAIEFVEKGNVIPDEDGRAIVDCINNSDHQILKKLTAKYKLIY